jgi:hypothetical protein
MMVTVLEHELLAIGIAILAYIDTARSVLNNVQRYSCRR